MLGQSIEGAVISEATFLPASGNIPEHCQLVGKMPQELNFKMKLPTQWNGGTVFIGGGGFDGHIDGIPQSPSILERGYSTISTNFGHESDTPFSSGSFALDNQMLNEYADFSVFADLTERCSVFPAERLPRPKKHHFEKTVEYFRNLDYVKRIAPMAVKGQSIYSATS